MALGTIAAIGGIASAASSFFGGKKAKKEAQKAAERQRIMGQKNADIIAKETAEELRRFDIGVEKTLDTGTALSAASGFGSGSSQELYLDSMAKEFEMDRDWMESSSQQRQDMAKLTGEYQAKSLESQGKSAFYQGIGGMFSGLTTAAAYTEFGKK